MEVGHRKPYSPIVQAIQEAEDRTSLELRVHLTQRWFESNPLKRAQNLLNRFQQGALAERPVVFFYINLRKRTFAILGNSQTHKKVGTTFLENLGKELSENLRATQSEKAIALTLEAIKFPE